MNVINQNINKNIKNQTDLCQKAIKMCPQQLLLSLMTNRRKCPYDPNPINHLTRGSIVNYNIHLYLGLGLGAKRN
jgi:hypothetical protein